MKSVSILDILDKKKYNINMYTYEFRIYPNAEAVELLTKWFRCRRYV
jgi:hypothetical protein